jgi:hypothetical protein
MLGLREWHSGTERKILEGISFDTGFNLSEGGIYQPRTRPRKKKKDVVKKIHENTKGRKKHSFYLRSISEGRYFPSRISAFLLRANLAGFLCSAML